MCMRPFVFCHADAILSALDREQQTHYVSEIGGGNASLAAPNNNDSGGTGQILVCFTWALSGFATNSPLEVFGPQKAVAAGED